jgi:thiamine kinase-like enzyme
MAIRRSTLTWASDAETTRWVRREGWNSGAWIGSPERSAPVVARRATRSHVDAACAAGEIGVGPVVIDFVDDWLFCEWIDGAVLTPLELRRPAVIDELSKLLSRLHDSAVVLPSASMAQSLREYAGDAAHDLAATGLDKCVTWALDALGRIDGPSDTHVPCHLDVAQNVVASSRGLRLIDYEFAAAATPAQELGQLIWEGELDRRGADQLAASYSVRSGHQVADWATWCLSSGVSWTVWAMSISTSTSSNNRAHMQRFARRSSERLRSHWAWEDGPACG